MISQTISATSTVSTFIYFVKRSKIWSSLAVDIAISYLHQWFKQIKTWTNVPPNFGFSEYDTRSKTDLTFIPPMLYSAWNYNILIIHINSRKLEELGVVIALSKSVTRFGSALAINSGALFLTNRQASRSGM